MIRIKQVATAAAIVVAGLFALLFTSGVASASDHSYGDGHSGSNERHSHSRDSRSDDSRSDDSRSDDKDKGGLEVAGIDLSPVTDAVSDLLNSLSGIL